MTESDIVISIKGISKMPKNSTVVISGGTLKSHLSQLCTAYHCLEIEDILHQKYESHLYRAFIDSILMQNTGEFFGNTYSSFSRYIVAMRDNNNCHYYN